MIYKLARYPILSFLTVWGLFTVITTPALARRQGGTPPDYVRGEILVRYKPGTSSVQILKTRESIRAQRIQKFRINNVQHYRLPKGMSVSKAIQKIKKSRHVLYVQPNYIDKIGSLPNDPGFPSLYGLDNRGQTGGTKGAGIHAPEAWDIRTDVSSSIVVAVIDTGIDYHHEDLAANIWTHPGETGLDDQNRDKRTNGIDDDLNGYVDDVYGWDCVNNDNNPMDDHGHGTRIAGIIAAVGNNSIGTTGVAWHAKVMALKACNQNGSCADSEEIAAIQYATEMGAKVINASWGGTTDNPATFEAIEAFHKKEGLFVTIAHNGLNLVIVKIKTGVDIDKIPMYPAAYELPNIISVAATDHHDKLWSSSNFGGINVDLAAPGDRIWTTHLSNRYVRYSGTSYAAPYVVGAAALIWSQFPGLTNIELKERILWSTDPIPNLQGKTVTGGRLNVANALKEDQIPPSPASDLQIKSTALYHIQLSWTATGNDGSTNRARGYDLRYSLEPITEGNWDNSEKVFHVPNLPQPQEPGKIETFTVEKLFENTMYYFALKVIDPVGNTSNLSNIVSASTLAATVVFSENFEYPLGSEGPVGWTTSGSDGTGGPTLWHFEATADTYLYTKKEFGHYDTGARNYGELISPPIDLTGKIAATLILAHLLQVEDHSPHDEASLWISVDEGAHWDKMFSSSTSHRPEEIQFSDLRDKLVLDLSKYDGEIIRIKFFFDSVDAYFNNYGGWLIDDVQVVAAED